MSSLPEPSPSALEHSRAVSAAIAAEITRAGGWISFARFMELALYAPGLGYYSAGLDKFGSGGDFVTAPEISSLFGQAVAHQAAQVLQQTGGNILEIGAGSGKLALDLMLELERLKQLPAHYFILELSADLRQRQQAAHRARCASSSAALRLAGQPAGKIHRPGAGQRGAGCHAGGDAGMARRSGFHARHQPA